MIGPAGENLVRFACVENNKWHSLGRGGAGAVIGSKKLKGVVFHGDKKVEPARPDEFKALVKDMAARGKEDAGVAAYRRGGTVNMVRMLNGVNSFPSRYWRTGHLDDIEPLTTETMRERFSVKNEVCPPCLMQCVKHNRVPDGPHEGLEIDGPEYETIYVFGGLCQIVDFAEIMYLNDICDRLGVDTMTGGNLCALAIEASRRGLIDLKLDFGDAEGVAAFLESMCRRDTSSATCSPRASSQSRRSSGSKASPSTSRAWSRPATIRARSRAWGWPSSRRRAAPATCAPPSTSPSSPASSTRRPPRARRQCTSTGKTGCASWTRSSTAASTATSCSGRTSPPS